MRGKEVNVMRNLELPSQSWHVEDAERSDTPETETDDSTYRSFHYAGS